MSDYWTDEEIARFGYFELDGVRSPGVLVAMELGDGTELKWDEQNGFGLSGSFTRFTGLGLAELKMKIRLVDAEDRTAFDSADWRRATAVPVQGQRDRIRSLRHPVTERGKPPVNLVTLRYSPFEQPATDEGGGVIVTYTFKAYRKPLPQVGKPLPPENKAEGEVTSVNQQRIAKQDLANERLRAMLEGTGIGS